MRASIQKMNSRLGDETVYDSDSDSSSSDSGNIMPENEVNTREFAIDRQFADKYYFITNVSYSFHESKQFESIFSYKILHI